MPCMDGSRRMTLVVGYPGRSGDLAMSGLGDSQMSRARPCALTV